jgi:hypothetical protein
MKYCAQPSRPSGGGEIRAGLAAAVDHHDRMGRPQRARNEIFHVHLPDHTRAFDRAVDAAADEEMAEAVEHQRLSRRTPCHAQ